MGGTNDPENLVYLTARRHFIIHRLLTKIYPDNPKIWYAFNLMFINTLSGGTSLRGADYDWQKSVSKKYDVFRENISIKLRTLSKDRIVSDETKEKIRNARKLQVISPESHKKTGDALRGKSRPKEVIAKILATKLLKKQISEAALTHDEIEAIKLSKIKPKLPRKPVSQETRKRISESHKGIRPSDEVRKKLSEIAKNRKFSEETRKK